MEQSNNICRIICQRFDLSQNMSRIVTNQILTGVYISLTTDNIRVLLNEPVIDNLKSEINGNK